MSGSKIVGITFSESHLQALLEDRRIVSTPLAWYPTLVRLSAKERGAYHLIGAGRGVEWESIDYQISLEGMLRGIPEAGAIVPVTN